MLKDTMQAVGLKKQLNCISHIVECLHLCMYISFSQKVFQNLSCTHVLLDFQLIVMKKNHQTEKD